MKNTKLIKYALLLTVFFNSLIGYSIIKQYNPFTLLLYSFIDPGQFFMSLTEGFGGYIVSAFITAIFTIRTGLQRAEAKSWKNFMLWSTILNLTLSISTFIK